MIVVTGDLGRNSCYVFAHNGILGYPVGKQISMFGSDQRNSLF